MTDAIDWSAVLADHSRWLRTVILARCGEFQAVEDVFQEVAAAAIRQQAPIADPSRVVSWLYQLAVRQSLMYRRKLGRKRKLEQNFADRVQPTIQHREPTDPFRWLLLDEQRRLVRLAITQIPARDAEVLLLKYTEGWSYQQIADHLGVSAAAIESRLHRARAKLREKLAKLDIDQCES